MGAAPKRGLSIYITKKSANNTISLKKTRQYEHIRKICILPTFFETIALSHYRKLIILKKEKQIGSKIVKNGKILDNCTNHKNIKFE